MHSAWLCLCVANTAAAADLRTLSRRAAVGASAQLWASQAAWAENTRGVQWRVTLPEGFSIARSLESVVRIRAETVLAAEDPVRGQQVKLLLIPFGVQAAGSFSPDEQLGLASYFLDAGKGAPTQADAEQVAKTMLTSAGRSPTVLQLRAAGSVGAATDANGRRYVRYAYESERCAEPLDGGECLSGAVSKRKSLAAVTVASISQYRTNTERQRMQEMGQERNVDVLWLLTASTRADADDAVLQQIMRSFMIP